MYHHFVVEGDDADSIIALLHKIEADVKGIKKNMAESFDNLQASLDAAGVSLTEVAADINGAVAEIAALKDQLDNGLSPEQAAVVQARMDTLVSDLADAAKIIDPAVPPA